MGSTTRIRAALLNNPTHEKQDGLRQIEICTGLTPSMACRSRQLIYFDLSANLQSKNHNSEGLKTNRFSLSFTYFIRHYYKYPCWFLFLHLLICLNSVGSRTSLEASFKVNLINFLGSVFPPCMTQDEMFETENFIINY